MSVEKGLLYAKSHEWVKEEGGEFVVGITDYAQSELGDLVFVIFRKKEMKLQWVSLLRM